MDNLPSPASAPERRAYSIKEFQQVFGISHTKTYEEIGSGRLLARKAGAKTLIAVEDALAWFASLPLAQPPVRP
jgi:hypothetical protein